MNYILKVRYVDTSGGEISNKQKICVLSSEFNKFIFSGSLIHRSINEVCFEPSLYRQFTQVLDMVSGGSKNNCLFTSLDPFSKSVHQRRLFFNWTDYKKVNLELIWELAVTIYLNHSIVFDASQGKVFHFTWDSSTKEKRLSIVWHASSNFFQLLCETHFEEPIALIVNNHLDIAQLKTGLLYAVHESTWSSDDNVRVE